MTAHRVSRKSPVKYVLLAILVLAGCLATTSSQAEEPAKGKWIQLFNGKNLEGWTPKICGYKVGENFGNTFRVEDGILKVGYEAYGEFGDRFGHLFYKDRFSHYIIRAEYRFTGEQSTGGPGWAVRNSGLMLHGQSPESMTQGQKFPVSIEVQLLGGTGTGDRTTANLCTPGTHVVMDGKLFKPHCVKSKSKTFHGEQWVTVEVEVRGNELFRHTVNGEEVMSYTEPQFDETDDDAKKLIEANGGVQIKGGSISLQSESHPVEFRKVELLVLKADG